MTKNFANVASARGGISLPVAVALSVFAAGVSHAAVTRDDLAQAVAPAIESGALQAMSLGVIQGGDVLTAHFGALTPQNAAAPDDHTLYEIGSITKVFTSLLLAEAVVRGEVTLDTPITTLLPADIVLPERAGERITLRMLATHTSGLPRIPAEIPSDDYRNPYAAYDVADLWETLRKVKLDFEPGAKASYSNLAAGLLGTLLARQAGQPYDALLAARITGPLGMKDTVLVPDAEQAARQAPPFNAAGEPWTHWDFKALAGAGGLRSTLADMTRFAAVMLRPEDTPLARAIALAWEKQELAAAISPGGQALGWMLAGDGQTRWHNGMTGGFHAVVYVNRSLNVATVLLANRSEPGGTAIAASVLRQAAGLPVRPAPNLNRAEVTLTAAQLDRCAGTYRLAPQFAIVVERRNLALHVTPTGQSTDRLYAASETTFFSRRVPADIVFELPEGDGVATALILHQNGREMRGARE